jgi:o-succinylbenzoate---CoA ligase
MIVEGWLHRAARTRPGWTAVEDTERGLSYAELHAAALAGAHALSARGVAPGDRVAIALPPGLAFAKALHACMLLGAVAVPVDVRFGPAERELVCDGAALVLEEPLTPASDAPSSAAGSAASSAASTAASNTTLGARHDLDAVAAVIHTSGTTSAARPVQLTYGNFLWSALGSAVALDLDPRERWLCALPVSHVGGLSILVRCAIYATTAVIHPRFDTDRVLRALCAQDITLVSLVATTLARLLDAGLARPAALRCALTGGGPVPEALIGRAREAGVPVSATYGLTEACSQVSTGGPPLFCTRVRVAQDGEILVGGPTVAPASRGPEGWLHTGDLGALDETGCLRVSGRIADTIISGGENVSPSEVEAVLEAHPAVLEAAVLGRADPAWGETVAAIVVPRAGADVQATALKEALLAHCAARLAGYKVPKQLDLSGAPLPRTRSGKLLRRELT